MKKDRNKQIGLFFGSFNPIHVGHLIIASIMVQEAELDEVWFVVSPQNPFKEKKSLLPEAMRLDIVKDAIAPNDKLRASDIEFGLPKPSYTIDTLTYLKEKHGEKIDFHLIMGSDNLVNFHKWKNYEQILEHHKIFAYNRPGSEETQFHNHPAVTIIDGPLLQISASMIRKYLKEGKSIQYLVTDPVLSIIERYGYYQ